MDEETTETTTTETETAATTAAETTAETTSAETTPARGAIPFPRFKEVIDERNQLRERAAAAEREAQVLREQQKAAPPQAPKHYTAAELQGLVDAGKITPTLASEQLAWQHAQRAKQEWAQEHQQQTRQTTATKEVTDYLMAVPALNDRTSPQFLEASRAAQSLAAELNLSVDDPRVQRLALQQTLGPLTKLAKTRALAEHARESSETVETAGGGGGHETTADPLKGIPKHYRDHWNRLGYSRERMVAEAKYIPASKRTG